MGILKLEFSYSNIKTIYTEQKMIIFKYEKPCKMNSGAFAPLSIYHKLLVILLC